MKPLLFDLNQHTELAQKLCIGLNAQAAQYEMRLFPDGESYIRCLDDVKGRDIYIFSHLHQPNEKILPLLLLASTLKDLGANSVGLIAPYLSYMRQDVRFHEGEGITSRYFAKLLSAHVDWLITVDPHLHRYKNLDEIYSIKSQSLTCVKNIADYIKQNIHNPVVIGPDGESKQWAEKVANEVDCPFEVLSKHRYGDRDIRISIPHVENYLGHTPVLVDDIISTGKTMILAAQHLTDAGLPIPTCVAVHGVFAEGSLQEMIDQGLQVVTCNSIEHESNQIDLSQLLCEGVKGLENK